MTRRYATRHVAASFLAGTLCLALAACGGGSGGTSGGGGGGGGGGSTWTPHVFLPSNSFAAQCSAPRSGINPETGQAYPDVQGSVLDENNFLRSWSDETYLWYGEITDQDPAGFNNPLVYFDELRTFATTPSGADKDQFHFTYPTDEWFKLSQSGVSAGYGAAWVIVTSVPPREAVVGYIEPGSPAATANLARGARVLSVDGAQVLDGPPAILNAGLFPETVGETHTFVVEDLSSGGNTREVTMTSEEVVSMPVQNVKTIASPIGTVGYLLFNDHIAPAEEALVNAVEQLATAGIDELVLDIRYNGGGYLAIASQIAYMIAGDAQTAGRTFEEVQFNDKHPSTNPVTGQPLQPYPFLDTTAGFSSLPSGMPLPTLNLQRVVVLTGPNTCSASEAIMNSLRGVDVEVIQIGSTTCGKPYGFYPTDNCGTTYFTIQFRGVNDKGFGEYPDGFSPVNTATIEGEPVPGCSVADDFEHALGDPLEKRFQSALAYLENGSCPAPSGVAAPGLSKTAAPLSATDGLMPKSPWRENRILRP
ncbi:MAG TPA: S41 family peptidase [Woeseiaceae bacterium]|nr:S41 family peptidase [Woeseiaceae bacterium]